MTITTEHYENHLADYYTWLYGGLASKVGENKAFFLSHDIVPRLSKYALDLGCGSGFQSIPLAQLGFNVISIDLSGKLLKELDEHKDNLSILAIKDSILNLEKHAPGNCELCVCMGDTLTHLDSFDEVINLFSSVSRTLEKNGQFILTFRDLTFELENLDRFIPVNQDSSKIFTCFLEYEDKKVKVHDLIYEKEGENWNLKKSFYWKLRISSDFVMEELKSAGFSITHTNSDSGFMTIIAKKII